MAYIAKVDVKTYLGIGGSGDDDLIDALIAQAQKYIEEQTGRVFEASADTTRAFDYDRHVLEDEDGRRRTLYLAGYDLATITSVVNGDGTTVAASQYVTEPRRETPYWALTLKQSASVAWTYNDTPEGAILVTGKWAYATAAPDDVKLATRDLTVWLYRRRGQEGASLDAPQMSPSGVMLFPPKMPETVKMTICRYQIKGVA